MRRKQIINYEGEKPSGRHKLTLVADIVKLDDDYLIVDLYSKKELIYREAYCSTGRFNHDYKENKTDTKNYWNNPKRRMLHEAYVTEKASGTIKKYAKQIGVKCYNDNPTDILEQIEYKIDGLQDVRKKNRANEEKDKLFEMLPEEPKRLQWDIERKANEGNIIYYKRHGVYTDYHCCQCGEDYTLRTEPYEGLEPVKVYSKPERLKVFECPRCGDGALLYPMGYAKCTYQNFTTFLYQVAAEDGTLITRMYDVFVTRTPEGARNIQTTECERVFMRPGYYRAYYSYNAGKSWSKDRQVALGKIYDLIEVNYDCINDSQMKYLPRDMYKTIYSKQERIERKYLARYKTAESFARCPQLETLFKNDFRDICRRIIWLRGSTKSINKHAKELHEILRITKTQLRFIKENHDASTVTLRKLEIFHIADRYGIKECDYDKLLYLCKVSSVETLDYLLRFQSLTKLWNVVCKYLEDRHFNNLREVLSEYKDYLHEREDNGDDLSNTIYLRPRNLYETYSRIRQEAEQKRDEKYIDDMQAKYPDIELRSEKIPKKYTFIHKGLVIRPAVDAKEIVMEGRILHHCVGSDSQRYLRNFNAGKGWILVIRHIDNLDKPYITVELKDNKIIQWYGEHDTKPDEEIIEEFLKEYRKHIDKKERKTA